MRVYSRPFNNIIFARQLSNYIFERKNTMKKSNKKTVQFILCLSVIFVSSFFLFYPKSSADAVQNMNIEICDIASSNAFDEIVSLANRGILPVFEASDGNVYFYPENAVTRELLATSLVKITNENVKKYSGYDLEIIDFEDIEKSNLNYIKTAAYTGIIPVYTEKLGERDILSFCPKKEISRGDAALIFAKLINGTASSTAFGTLTDLENISDETKKAIEKVIGFNVMSSSDDLFRPNEPITREELARALCALLEHIN